MDIRTLCQGIAMPEEMVQKVYGFAADFDFSAVEENLNRMMESTTAADACARLQVQLGDDPEGVAMLSCQLYCACQICRRYREMNIPDSVFFDTMGCYTRFVRECCVYKGSCQFDRGWWTWRQISMRLFRLGELEFEQKPNGTVAIHIPSDARFTPALVEKSIAMAKSFIPLVAPQYANADFTCRSWLLSPYLAQLLGDSSNILSFRNRFDIREVEEDDYSFIPWLFQCVPDTPVSAFPERTTLQRKAKKYILSGGKIGIAFGVLK